GQIAPILPQRAARPRCMPASSCLPLPDCSVVVPANSWLLPNAFEGLIMIRAVIALRHDTADDAPRAPVARPRRLHRVLAVITARLPWQHPLVVPEHPAVAVVGGG